MFGSYDVWKVNQKDKSRLFAGRRFEEFGMKRKRESRRRRGEIWVSSFVCSPQREESTFAFFSDLIWLDFEKVRVILDLTHIPPTSQPFHPSTVK